MTVTPDPADHRDLDDPSRTPGTPERDPGLEVLSRERCLDLLRTTTVGRIAFDGDEGVVLLPVNYRVTAQEVLLRTSATGTLAQLARGAREVVFEVDYHARTARSGWSVLVRGAAGAVTDEQLLASPEVARVVPWAASQDHSLVLAVALEQVTGRSVG